MRVVAEKTRSEHQPCRVWHVQAAGAKEECGPEGPHGETQGTDSQARRTLGTHVHTSCMWGGGGRVQAPQDPARAHARCSLRVEGCTTEIQTLKREGPLSARPALLWGDSWGMVEVIT